MKHSLFLLAAGVAAMSLAAVACSDDDTDPGTPSALDSTVDSGATPPTTQEDAAAPEDRDGGNTPADAGSTECTQTIATTTATTFTELCTPDAGGSVKHVRIEGIQIAPTHKFAAVMFNYPTAPTEAQASGRTLDADRGRVLLYSGGPPPPAMVTATVASTSATLGPDASYVTSVNTICFDVTDGAAGTAPVVTYWVTGQKGANCTDRATLSTASAFATSTGLPQSPFPKAEKHWFGQSPSQPAVTITVSSVAAL